MKATMKLISTDNHGNQATNYFSTPREIEFDVFPIVGNPFVVALPSEGGRIWTSPVAKLTNIAPGMIGVHTKNSLYSVSL